MIPLELMTMLGSGLLTGVMTLWSKSLDNKKEVHRMTMEAFSATESAIQSAREFKETGLSFTRRILAIGIVFSVTVLPKLAALFYPEVDVVVGYTEWHPGFLFFDGKEEIVWRAVKGLAITPLDTHLCSAVIGLYFGHKATK